MRSSPAGHSAFPGSMRLFQFRGIEVFLHWSWAIVAVLEIQSRLKHYQSPVWNVIEYLSLFAIVLMHEFGHALACRSVGGRADHILLWPLGGVAYVRPPHRPGAFLWSIVAGPLVNVVLVPVLFGLLILADRFAPDSDAFEYVATINYINGLLLAFNLLPIYPLDGGQIFQSILWFFLGYARSLLIASGIGMVAAAAIIVLALVSGNFWFVILAAFGISQSYRGLMHAAQLGKLAKAARSERLRCPGCGEPAPRGPAWQCACGQRFDIFASGGRCPNCMAGIALAPCPFCGKPSRPADWGIPAPTHDFTA